MRSRDKRPNKRLLLFFPARSITVAVASAGTWDTSSEEKDSATLSPTSGTVSTRCRLPSSRRARPTAPTQWSARTQEASSAGRREKRFDSDFRHTDQTRRCLLFFVSFFSARMVYLLPLPRFISVIWSVSKISRESGLFSGREFDHHQQREGRTSRSRKGYVRRDVYFLTTVGLKR